MIVLSVAAVIVYSLFGEDSLDKFHSYMPIWVYYAALSVIPLLTAGATVAMRKLPKLNDAVVLWYLNLSILATSLTVVLISHQGFEVFKNFSWQSWVILIAIGLVDQVQRSAKFKALKL